MAGRAGDAPALKPHTPVTDRERDWTLRVLSVSLHCVRPPLCGDEEETGVVWSNSTCPEQWEHLLRAAADQRNVTQTDTSCFVCQANVNMPELDHYSSSSAEAVYVEVSLTLQQNDTAPVHLTLFGHNNNDSQYLHLSDQEGGKENYASLRCPPSADGANHSCCHLLFSSGAFARGWLPWKRTTEGEWSEWRCVLRVTWLSLLCVVLLLIVITVAQQIMEGRKRRSAKMKIHPFDYTCQGHLIDRAKRTEVNTLMVLSAEARGPYMWSALSSIEEVETPEETEAEVFFSDNMDNDYNGNIHHRSSRSPSARRAEQSITTAEPS